MKKLVVLSLLCILVLAACKKKKTPDPTPTPNPTPTATAEELMMDSVYLFSRELYLWNTLMGTYTSFNPRQYKGSTELASAQGVMTAIKKLQPNDRFSFVTTIDQSNSISTGDDVDYGLYVQPFAVDYAYPLDSIYWFVPYVYKNSPAGLAGVKRGWIINKIGSTTLGYNQSTIDLLNSTLFSTTNTATFEFIKPDGTKQTNTLTKTSFTANSVMYNNVFTTTSGTKVGYFVLDQFLGQNGRNEIGTIFNSFQSAGVTEMVVDLRYNGGGVVATQDTLANLLLPASANSKTMYTYDFNSDLKNNIYPLMKSKRAYGDNWFTPAGNSVNVIKKGTLNLSRIFFIVGSGTASASELLINNLRPYMSVKLIGDTTYGKPVGFFPVYISNFAIYPISFRTINSAGTADYYNGFAPDKIMYDDVTKDWGDPAEASFYTALKYIVTGSFKESAGEVAMQQLKINGQAPIKPVSKLFAEKSKISGMFLQK